MHDFKSFYEGYHKKRLLPKRIIGKKDFTYRHVVATLDKFCRNKNVLDVGSGVGTLDFYLASQGNIVLGIEISQRAIKVAQHALKNFKLESKIEFIRADFFDVKLPKKYDFVICSEVLEHLKNDQQAMRKISDLTKKNGLAMITVPSQNAPLIKFGAIKKFDQISGHLRRYTLESLVALMENNNFKVIYAKKTEGLLRNSLYVFRLNLLIRLANKFPLVSDLISWLDYWTLKFWGESQLIIVAKPVRKA